MKLIFLFALLAFSGCVTTPDTTVQNIQAPDLSNENKVTDTNFLTNFESMKHPSDGLYSYAGTFKSKNSEFSAIMGEGELSYTVSIAFKGGEVTAIKSNLLSDLPSDDLLLSNLAESLVPKNYYDLDSLYLICNKGFYPYAKKGCEPLKEKPKLDFFSILPSTFGQMGSQLHQFGLDYKETISIAGQSCFMYFLEMPAQSNIVYSPFTKDEILSFQSVPTDTPNMIFRMCIDDETHALDIFSISTEYKENPTDPLFLSKLELVSYEPKQIDLDSFMSDKFAILSSTCTGGSDPSVTLSILPFESGARTTSFTVSNPYPVGPAYSHEQTELISFEKGKVLDKKIPLSPEAGIESVGYSMEVCINDVCGKKPLCDKKPSLVIENNIAASNSILACEPTFGYFLVKDYKVTKTKTEFTIVNQNGVDVQTESIYLHGLYGEGNPEFRQTIPLVLSLPSNIETKVELTHDALFDGSVKLFYDFKYSGGSFNGTTSSEVCTGVVS